MSKSHRFSDQTQGVGVAAMFPDQVKQKTFLLAGLKKGDLAATTADALAYGGAGTIIFTGLSQRELQPVIDHLNRKHRNVKMLFVPTDTASLSSVRDAANTIKKMGVSIDGFVGFPTVMAVPWEPTEDGNESHFQQNYLAYFLLIRLLLDCMSPASRVVLVTASLRTEASAPAWEDVGFAGGETYHCLDGFAQSMLANIQFVKSLAKIGKDRSISAFSANPGNTKTNVQTYVAWEEISSWLQLRKEAGEDLPILLQQAPKSLAQGSATVLRGLLDPDLEESSGAFLDHCQAVTLPYLDFPAGEESAEALWRRSQELVEAFLG
ncbi:hypothetical protein N7467_005791 [Penicillium canescens]|nr:hypothetical protein N7467_005791 [Penicillium canescens]